MSSPTKRPLSAQVGPIISLVGGATAIGSYFFPWLFTFDQKQEFSGVALHAHTGWDLATRVFLLSHPDVNPAIPQLDPTSGPSLFFILALPLLMAALAVIVTGIGMAKPNAILKGLAIGATQIGLFASFGEAIYVFILEFVPNSAASLPVGLGFPLLFIGYLLLISGAITHALSGKGAAVASASAA